MNLKKTPFHTLHLQAGARMVEFAGWEMPVQYQGARQEHLAVRSTAGVFDVSHMGELEIRGPGAMAVAQRVTCNDISRLSDGQAQYTAFLTPAGTMIDDVVLYRFAEDRFLICVNAANQEKDLQWLCENRSGNVEIVDRSAEFAQLAVQGPEAQRILQPLCDHSLDDIRFYWFREGNVAGVPTLVSRTGYTGEDGFELYLDPVRAPRVWEALFETGEGQGLVAAGLAARNTLRLEMKFALYGNDIDETTTPLEAGLGWIVKLDKGDFHGRAALARQKESGVPRKLIGFEMQERGIPRDHYPVYLDSEQAGQVTSGSYAPSLETGIGMAYLPSGQTDPGQQLWIGIREKRVRAEVVRTPFYRRVPAGV